MTRLHIHVCPLCAAYVETESGYDGPYYIWDCDHEGAVEPERMTINQFLDPEHRELGRSLQCLILWRKMHEDYLEYKRPAYDEPFDPTLKHPAGIPYDRKHRRDRHVFRHQPYTTQFDRILKHLYAPKIKEALEQGRHFFAASIEEHHAAHCGFVVDFNRQAYGQDGDDMVS